MKHEMSEKAKKLSIGAVIKEPGSTVKTKTGGWRTFKPVTDYKECIKCGKCWAVCPEAAYKQNKEGFFEVDLDYCKGCGICAKECPKKCIKMELEEK